MPMKKRNEELKVKHSGLSEDFRYNLELLRERDDELDKLEKELVKKEKGILSLTKSVQQYKQQIDVEKNMKLKQQQLLKSAHDKIQSMENEHLQKVHTMEQQNTRQTRTIAALQQENETEKQSKEELCKKYESRLDDLMSKLSAVQNQFEIEKRSNRSKIEEYLKAIDTSNEKCSWLEKSVSELGQNLNAKENEFNQLHARFKEKEGKLSTMELELTHTHSHHAVTENVLSRKDEKILQLECDVQELHAAHSKTNEEKHQLSQELDQLSAQLASVQSAQQHSMRVIDELTANHEHLQSENESLRKQNQDIRNVTQDMKSAIAQLHQLSNVDKQQNKMELHEMQKLIQENEQLKQQLSAVRNQLREKERELSLLRTEKMHLSDISNRYHHQLNARQYERPMAAATTTAAAPFVDARFDTTLSPEQPSPLSPQTLSQSLILDGCNDGSVDSRTELKFENAKLMKKIKDLQSSLTNTDASCSKSVQALPSKHSIRRQYDQTRRQLNAGLRSKSVNNKHPVRNW
eukprot:CAMPEP_0202692508 /NCGR_PEP_ID=MMETSP1385-20130828/6865_1 /ASSEMBLY_ACC=CAM_ASM_000861 /TAXON_ID=933848 /ORGANISM="Elphidium margaritaceum" /LENGTH=519 /DNA_ID=CAMNT_0049348047 /DNA_START=150 /DNA_END=1706 /DNA_ORIENTATION=+